MMKSMRAQMMEQKVCWICGTVDENGGVDFAGSGLYWYCEDCLKERDEAAMLPSQRVSYSYN